MRRFHSYHYIIAAFLLLAGACAKMSTPTGGPRDRTPPAVVTSMPANGTKNFNGREIEIEFNEYIVLDNINEKFMVSPPVKKKPRVFTRGKSIRIQFDEQLRDSVTYTLYFMDAIKDLNEGNILDNYRFVFSTGSVIDSLSLTGNVYSAFNLEVPEKTTVLLYRKTADSAVMKELPDYLSRVDQTGYFRIDNISPGKYRLFALKDDDNSKTYNRVEEPFAFLDTLISVTPEKNFIAVPPDTVKHETTIKLQTRPQTNTRAPQAKEKAPEPVALQGVYKLILFEGQKRAHYLAKSSRDAKYKLTYILSMPPDTMKYELTIPDSKPDSWFMETSRYRDSITVWLTDSSLYSQPLINTLFRYPFTDSLGINGYKLDTIPMRFSFPKVPKSVKTSKRTVLAIKSSQGALKPGQSMVFDSETPLKQPDTTKIQLYTIFEKSRERMPYSFDRDSLHSGRLILRAKLNEGGQYLFVADSAAFSNIYNEVNDSIGLRFSVREKDTYSKLSLELKNVPGNSIIQLLDNTERLIEQQKVSSDGTITFPLVDPGQYRIKAIYDVNGDGKWTTGDFFSKRQPESVSYYPDVIEIKQGWDVTQPWNTGVLNFKDQKLRQKTKK